MPCTNAGANPDLVTLQNIVDGVQGVSVLYVLREMVDYRAIQYRISRRSPDY